MPKNEIGPVMQMAYLVEDLDRAIARWRQLGVGPFFVSRHPPYKSQVYRGQPTACDFSIGLAYWGEMQIELVQQHDDAPSAFREFQREHGYGLHHLGVLTEDIEGDLRKLDARGIRPIHRMLSALDVDTVYLDHLQPGGAMLELIQRSPAIDTGFATMRQMTQDWDGGEPSVYEF